MTYWHDHGRTHIARNDRQDRRNIWWDWCPEHDCPRASCELTPHTTPTERDVFTWVLVALAFTLILVLIIIGGAWW